MVEISRSRNRSLGFPLIMRESRRLEMKKKYRSPAHQAGELAVPAQTAPESASTGLSSVEAALCCTMTSEARPSCIPLTLGGELPTACSFASPNSRQLAALTAGGMARWYTFFYFG